MIVSLGEGHVEVLHHGNTALREVVDDSGKCRQVPSEATTRLASLEATNNKSLTTSRTSTRLKALA